jgi:hypothetical protein
MLRVSEVLVQQKYGKWQVIIREEGKAEKILDQLHHWPERAFQAGLNVLLQQRTLKDWRLIQEGDLHGCHWMRFWVITESFAGTTTEIEAEKINAWIQEHATVCTTATACRISFTFSQTGVGEVVHVVCSCGEKCDLTDYDSF